MTATTETNGTKTKIEAVKICIERNSNGLYLSIKSSKKFEELFKNNEVRPSSVATDEAGRPLKYYYWGSNIPADKKAAIEMMATDLNGNISNYGANLMIDGVTNFSVLRTVGISDGVKYKIDDGLYSVATLNAWQTKAATFAKKMVEASTKPTRVYSIVVVEE